MPRDSPCPLPLQMIYDLRSGITFFIGLLVEAVLSVRLFSSCPKTFRSPAQRKIV
jgi:hypothetical protein